MFPFLATPRAIDFDFDALTDATQLHPLFAGRYRWNAKTEAVEPAPIDAAVSAVGE
jgi:hypothetical protein